MIARISSVESTLLAVLVVLAGCDNAGSGLAAPPLGTGTVTVQAYLDRDGSRSLTQADTFYAGARVSLRATESGSILRTFLSSNLQMAILENVTYGEYLVTVDPASIGDSLLVGSISDPRVRVQATGTPPLVTIRLSYPDMSVRQARQASAGKRVMIRGLVLAGVQSFRDTTSHVSDTSRAIRLTRASVRGGGGGNNPGDSVTVLGTVSSRAGQPTLDQALLTVFSQRPGPIPVALTSAVAATAQGGALDAGLVLVTSVVISESAAQGPDFRVVASDGSGPLTILLDGNIPVNAAAFPVGRIMTVRGVLVPDGAGKWQLKPRNAGDITLL